MQQALEDLFKAECPGEILTTEGTEVTYFKDFESDNSQVSETCTQILHLWTEYDLGFSQFSDFLH